MVLQASGLLGCRGLAFWVWVTPSSLPSVGKREEPHLPSLTKLSILAQSPCFGASFPSPPSNRG